MAKAPETFSIIWADERPDDYEKLNTAIHAAFFQIEYLAAAVRAEWRNAEKANNASDLAARTAHIAKWLDLIEEQDDVEAHRARLSQHLRESIAKQLAEGPAN